MATHYDVLGVSSSATLEEIRAAYLDRARQLHPDRLTESVDVDRARRAMQDVNEAWRVLRDSSSRSIYDHRLEALDVAATQPESPPFDDDWMDRPYHGRPVEAGDLTVVLVRAAPWVVVLIVLGAIVVFTAFAKHTNARTDLIGACIVTEAGVPREAPCDEPNDGRVVSVVDEENLCATGTTARVVAAGDWYCLRDARAGSG